MLFPLAAAGQIRGDQLADEILRATGIDVLSRYVYRPPDQVEIIGADIEASAAVIGAIVAVHVPDPQYFQAERDANALWSRVRLQAQSAVGVDLASLTATQVRALLAVLLRRARALSKDGTVRPLDDWGR